MKKTCFIVAIIILYWILLPTVSFSKITQAIKLMKIISLVHTNYVVSAKIYSANPNQLFLTARGKQQTGDGGGIFIFNITKPEDPKLITQWQPSSLQGFTTQDNSMEGQDRIGNTFVSVSVATGKLYVFTISASGQLKLKSWLTLKHTCFITCLIDKFKALHVKLYREKETGKLYALITSPQAETLIAVDITNLAQPIEVAYITLNFFPILTGAESIYIHDEYAYVGAFNGHYFKIINLSTLHTQHKPSLTLSNAIDNPYYNQLVSTRDPRAEYPNILYSASWSNPGGLIAFDLKEPQNPVKISSAINGQLAKANRVKLNSNFAYLPLETDPGGIGIVNIAYPYRLSLVKTITDIHDTAGNQIRKPYTLAITHNYLYLFGTAGSSTNKMAIFKLSYTSS